MTRQVAQPAAALPIVPRALSPGTLLLDRYQVEAALGQGGMGVVYRALDQQTGQPVAVKTFFAPPGMEEGQRRFQREFRALMRLQHPRIVRVFDYGEANGLPFYVMEFIAGQDLGGLRRSRGGRLPIREITAISLQLCDALAYIHAHGIIHRDLKPSNVMLENGQLPTSNLSIKLVDFGLAKLSDVSIELTQSGIMLGTVAYMSPDQAQAMPIDARSDLYSLGVVLYELASGQLPFSGDTPVAVIIQHISQDPPPLRSLDPALPADFEALVLSLLAKHPGQRPPSAEAVLNALSNLTSLTAPAPVEIAAAPRADAVFRAGLIGRQAELERLTKCLEQAWAGEGQLMTLEGEAGVGKTRLATEMGGQVRLRGGQRLVGACHETERVPYAPIAEWVSDALSHGDDLEALVSGLEPELARLVPRLVQTNAAATGDGLDPQQAKLRFFDAVTRLLTRLSERKPLMLLMDDLQWADDATLELLHYLIRNARGQRIFICATARSEERDEAGPLARLLRDLSRLRLIERIRLERLSPQSTAELIAAMLGMEESPPELAERIYAESEGNPFFVEEILKALAEEGLLARQEGRWRLQAELGMTMLRIPSTIVDVIERRLASLAEAERGALNWAAVLGHEFIYTVLQAASSIEEDALLDTLDNLLRDQLIAEVRDPRQDKYRFTHAKIQEVVYSALSGARRRKMHRSAGEAIERLYPTRLEEMSPVLAKHFSQGGDTPKALMYNVTAGDQARQVYANQEAIAFYRQAIELIEGQPQGQEIERLIAAHQGLGEVHHLIGDYEQAAEHFQAVIGLAPQTQRDKAEQSKLIAQAWRQLGQTHETRGEYEKALHCYDQGLSQLGISNLEEWGRLMNATAWVYVHQGAYEKAQSQCEQAISVAANCLDIVATAYGYLGVAARLQGNYEQAITYHEQSLALWEKAGDKAQVAKALNSLGTACDEGGNVDKAIEYYQKSLALCQEIGHNLGTAFLLNNLGVIHQDRGQLELAQDNFQQSLGIFQRIGSKEGMAMTYNNLAEICIARHDNSQAMDYLRQGESILEEMGHKYGLIQIRILMAEAMLAERHLDEAQNYALQVLEMADGIGMKPETGKAHQLLGQIHLQLGRTDQACHHLNQACELFKATGKQTELEQARAMLQRACHGKGPEPLV